MKVKKEDLKEYRRPAPKERERITLYLERQIKRLRSVRVVFAVFTGLLTLAMLIGTVWDYLEGKPGKELALKAVLSGIFLMVCLAMTKWSMRNKRLLQKITEGDFEVLDCIGEYFNGHIESVASGTVYVSTLSGVNCANEFLIDRKTARQYEGQTGIPLLLVRQQRYHYYEMLTENKLKGDKEK